MGCADERLDMNEHAGGMEKNQCISQHVTDTVIAYRMKEKFFSFADDADVKDHFGHVAFKVCGKIMSLRNRKVLKDKHGQMVAVI